MNFNSHAVLTGIRPAHAPKVQQKTHVEDLSVPASGGHFMVSVPVESGERWSIAANTAWLHVVGKHSGVGPDVVMFNVQANPFRHSRQAHLQDASSYFNIEQELWARTCLEGIEHPPKFRFIVRQDAKLT
jgi:hypothetical protein